MTAKKKYCFLTCKYIRLGKYQVQLSILCS